MNFAPRTQITSVPPFVKSLIATQAVLVVIIAWIVQTNEGLGFVYALAPIAVATVLYVTTVGRLILALWRCWRDPSRVERRVAVTLVILVGTLPLAYWVANDLSLR